MIVAGRGCARASLVASCMPVEIFVPAVNVLDHDGRFAVVTFAPGTVPPIGQHLSVYHNGLKVGDLKVTGPQRETDTVADIVAGEVSVHDEARAE